MKGEAVMAFECTVGRDGDALAVLPRGDLDMESIVVLRELLKQAIESGEHARIAIDMQDVTFLDSSGIGMLVAAQRAAAARDITLMLHDPGPMIRMVLQIANLDGTLVAS
jgi:anti-anti-sigma factor